MWVNILEVALVVLLGVVLLAPRSGAHSGGRGRVPAQNEPGREESGRVRWARRIAKQH